MAELFTLTLGRDIELWLEIQQQQQPESETEKRYKQIPGEREE